MKSARRPTVKAASDRKAVEATAVIVGTIIGAGIFGIPFAFAQVGLLPALGLLVGLSAGVLLVHFLFGEIILRTRARHRVVGYAERYLGRRGKALIALSEFVSGYGGLLAYTILGGIFLKTLFGAAYGGSELLYGMLFLAAAAIGVARGVRLIGREELVMSALLVAALIAIVIFSLPHINSMNWRLWSGLNLEKLVLAYGILLFAMGGIAAVPEAREVLEGSRRESGRLRPVNGRVYKKVIRWGTLLPAGLYLLFALAVVGVTGELTSEEAISGLSSVLGRGIVSLGAAFGLLAIFTSFLVTGDNLKKIFWYDYGLRARAAAWLVVIIPAAAYLGGLRDFISVIGVVGTIMGGITGVAILWMYARVKRLGRRRPEYTLRVPGIVLILTALIFIVGMFYALAGFLFN